jgi:hypothetical protein
MVLLSMYAQTRRKGLLRQPDDESGGSQQVDRGVKCA